MNENKKTGIKCKDCGNELSEFELENECGYCIFKEADESYYKAVLKDDGLIEYVRSSDMYIENESSGPEESYYNIDYIMNGNDTVEGFGPEDLLKVWKASKKHLLEELEMLSAMETFTSPCGKEIDLWGWIEQKKEELK